jgi:hypothetical protein
MATATNTTSTGGMIFLSYRRDDSGGHVGRLYDALSSHFGSKRLFMDIDHISPGQDFVQVVDDAVTRCAILLVVMGKRWAGSGRVGRRRIDVAGDFVRLEVAGGLRRKELRVMPVLVGGATMLPPDELPEDIRELARRNAIELSDTRWKEDVARLIAELDRALGPIVAPSTPRSMTVKLPTSIRLPTSITLPTKLPLPKTVAPWAKWGGLAAAVVVIGLVLRGVLSHGSTIPAAVPASIPSQFQIAAEPLKPLPGQLAAAGRSALAKAQTWRSDAVLALINAKLVTDARGIGTYEVDYTFRSPADGAGLVVVTGVAGGGGPTVKRLPAAGGAVTKPLPGDFVDLPNAAVTARDSGMLGDVRTALLSAGFGGRVGQPTWMLKGTAGDSYRPYYVDGVTGKLLHGSYRDPTVATTSTQKGGTIDPIGAIKGLFGGGSGSSTNKH